MNSSVAALGMIGPPKINVEKLLDFKQSNNANIHTSGCHKSSIPLAGSDLGIIRLLGFSLGETTWISFFFLLAPKQPKFSAGTEKVI